MSFVSPEKIAAIATDLRRTLETQRPSELNTKELAKEFNTGANVIGQVLTHLGWKMVRTFKAGTEKKVWVPPIEVSGDTTKLRELLRRGPRTFDQLSEALKTTTQQVERMCEDLRSAGYLVHEFGGHVEISKQPGPSESTEAHILRSDKKGYTKFGYVSDSHLCSKYAREDCLAELYNWFAGEGVSTVFNTGNWIDGEARFNKHDIFVHGMENQVNYFVEHYPQRKGIVTKFISGDDHEGWYGQREGIDIGAFTESKARSSGRKDLVHLGFIESFVTLEHLGNGSATQLLLVHPGGGSAYATSYAPQKFVEALQGGEKPGMILFGHWHKIFDLLIRNTICLGGGCTKDLDPFGRKMKLAYHIGGLIVETWQDEKGAIERWRVEKRQFFDRGYYNDQWRYAGQPKRIAV